MNEENFQKFFEKHEDQVLARVLLAWRLLDANTIKGAYQDMQQLHVSGEHCKLGQVLIKKRLLQMADYAKAMQVVRQQITTLYQRTTATGQQQLHDTHKKSPIAPGIAGNMQNTQKKAGEQKSDETKNGKPPGNDEPAMGKKFGAYEIINEIARGGMGIVYKARQHPLNRIVALKVLLSGGAASDIEIERFQREAEAAGALQHTNIVSIYEIGEQDGYHYFTMDFIDGVTMQDMIKKKTRRRKLLQMMEKVASALEHAHERDVVHRDIKPSNILVTSDGEPKLTDFGLAKKLDANTMLTESGATLGTPFYMAPEQTLGSRDVDARVDIYAMGVILYEILTGRLPFVADTLVDLYRKIVEEEPASPSKNNRNVDKELEIICLKAMEKSPQHRYQKAQEMADDIARYLGGEQISTKRSSLFDRIQRKLKNARQKIAIFGGIGLVLLSIIFFVVLKTTETSEREKKIQQARMLTKEGEDLIKKNKYEKGLAKLREAIKVHPQYLRAYFLRGEAYRRQKQYLNAIGEYDRILLRSPKNPVAFYKKGESYALLKQWDSAIEYFSKAIDNKPSDKIKVLAHHKRGETYNKRGREGDYEKAIEDYNKAEALKSKKGK